MDLKLRGLRALVAGSSRGLGYATALGLAREGAAVALNGRDPEKLGAAANKMSRDTEAQVIAAAGDVTDPAVPEALVAQVVGAFGGLDLLVTNASGPPSGKFETFDDPTWQKAIDLSLMSHVRLIRAALPHLRRSKAASVLTITSYSVKQPIPNLVLSNSVRLATVGLTKSLALELGAEGIRFNSILPAWTETERVYELLEARAKASGGSVENELARQAKESPLGRMGQPEEFANAAVFLLSPVASYITGVMLTVDGGMYKGTL
ncbi:MAG: 3-oxoacyl-ACP reductase [Chloroflexi bacterium RBG_16_57_11]|nr:MAG: 3-oxoacyl-ACP reductase [Chloroflexi bacterium RBG_16_57_11]